MKIPLTKEYEKLLRGRYPCLVKAEQAIYDILGVSLEDLRSDTHMPIFVEARCLFWALCREQVYPRYLISSYLDRDHSTGTYWKKFFEDRCDIDDSFVDLYKRLTAEFNKLI